MTLKLVPKNIKNLKELKSWVDQNVLNTETVIGIRRDCKITKIQEFSFYGPRWTMYGGVSIYFNF